VKSKEIQFWFVVWGSNWVCCMAQPEGDQLSRGWPFCWAFFPLIKPLNEYLILNFKKIKR